MQRKSISVALVERGVRIGMRQSPTLSLRKFGSGSRKVMRGRMLFVMEREGEQMSRVRSVHERAMVSGSQAHGKIRTALPEAGASHFLGHLSLPSKDMIDMRSLGGPGG